MDNEEWLQGRLNGIGGSEAAIVMGLSPWRSKLELWTEKVTKNIIKRDSPVMSWGRKLEPVVRTEYAEKTGRSIVPIISQRTRPDYPFMIANIDGLIIDDPNGKVSECGQGVLEIKTKSAFERWEEGWEEGKPPIYYTIQLQHYLFVNDKKWGSFAILDLGKMQLIHFDVERNEDLIELIVKEEEKFWNSVINKVKPEVDASKACSEFLKTYYSKSEKITLNIIEDEDATKWALQFRDAKLQMKLLKDQELEAKNHLMEIVGSAERATGNGYNISWKAPKDKKVFKLELFEKEHPDLIGQYVDYEPQTRRFTVRFKNKPGDDDNE